MKYIKNRQLRKSISTHLRHNLMSYIFQKINSILHLPKNLFYFIKLRHVMSFRSHSELELTLGGGP